MKMAYLFCLAAAALAGRAQQDALVAAPDRYQLAYESHAVRVIRVRWAQGKASPLHTHPPYPALQVALTDVHVITTGADGVSRESQRDARTVRYSPGGGTGAHSTRGLSESASRLLRIESKLRPAHADPPAAPLADSHFAVEQDDPDFRVTRGKFAPVENTSFKLALGQPAVIVFFGHQKWRVRDERGHHRNSTFEDGSFLFQLAGPLCLEKKLDHRPAELVVLELKGRSPE